MLVKLIICAFVFAANSRNREKPGRLRAAPSAAISSVRYGALAVVTRHGVAEGEDGSESIGAALTISTSTAPCVSGHSPISRAGKTFVSLTTRRSFAVTYAPLSET